MIDIKHYVILGFVILDIGIPHCEDCHRDYTKREGTSYRALNYVAKGKVKVIAEIFLLDDVGDPYEKVTNENVRFLK
jgi:hypothetical protein